MYVNLSSFPLCAHLEILPWLPINRDSLRHSFRRVAFRCGFVRLQVSQLYKTAVKSLSVGIDLKILVHSGCLRPIHQNRCIIFIVKRMSEDKKLSPGRTPTKTKCSVIKIRSSSTLRITLGVQRLESHRYEHVASSSLISAGASSNELRDHVTCLCQRLSQRCTLSMKHSFIVSA